MIMECCNPFLDPRTKKEFIEGLIEFIEGLIARKIIF
jgi:hypothetical protein